MLRRDVVVDALEVVAAADAPEIVLISARPALHASPRKDIERRSGVAPVCGRFEGLDQRAIDACGLEEISIGD